jgi:hypothetical protein
MAPTGTRFEPLRMLQGGFCLARKPCAILILSQIISPLGHSHYFVGLTHVQNSKEHSIVQANERYTSTDVDSIPTHSGGNIKLFQIPLTEDTQYCLRQVLIRYTDELVLLCLVSRRRRPSRPCACGSWAILIWMFGIDLDANLLYIS